MKRKAALVGLVAFATVLGAGVVYAASGAEQGPSSSQSPFLVRATPGVVTKSILSTGDSVGGYRMAGIPDGLGAYDNGDGTFTVLMNHEHNNAEGVAHTHNASLGAAGKGAFVSKWVIDKHTLTVSIGGDMMQTRRLP